MRDLSGHVLSKRINNGWAEQEDVTIALGGKRGA